jgi:hypothetical protein
MNGESLRNSDRAYVTEAVLQFKGYRKVIGEGTRPQVSTYLRRTWLVPP